MCELRARLTDLAYCIGYNALTYVYMVEMFPYYVRTKGLSWFQLFGRTAVMFGKLIPTCLSNVIN